MAIRHHDRPILEEQGLTSGFNPSDIYEMGGGTLEVAHGAVRAAPDFIRAGY
jgi:hypothetical protein